VIERANQVERWIESLPSSAAKKTNSDEFNIFAQYLLTKVTTDNLSVPMFKGLPKVHKPLWNRRPIIPSHSWITAGASIVPDYLLQPVFVTLNRATPDDGIRCRLLKGSNGGYLALYIA